MSQQRRNSIEQIEPTPVLNENESKLNVNHYEDVEGGIDEKMKDVSHVQDSDAQGYVDPDLVIDDEENKRLRKIINWRYVGSLGW
jgi:isopentenyl phosphate kinase